MSTQNAPVVTLNFAVNPIQSAAILSLIAAFQTVRSLAVTVRQIASANVPTVSNYGIAATSTCIEILGPDGNVLPDFCPIECKRTGRFALPSIRSYKEGNVPNALLAYPKGVTAFDAALFADSHVRKQGGAWQRAPQAAPATTVGALATTPAATTGTVPAVAPVTDKKEEKPAEKVPAKK